MSQFGNETNSFSIGRTTWETLVPNGWVKAEDVIESLEGIRCGYKKTSCPDQLAQALKEMLSAS